jgi:hypothetical protein
MIMLKNTGSELFEEAYFILKDKNGKSPILSETDMIREANKIVANNAITSYWSEKDSSSNKLSLKYKIIWYAAGLCSCGILWLGYTLF